jgi:hypothetical protein
MDIVISIFALPSEIDNLERVVSQLKKASHLLSDQYTWHLDIKLCLADEINDWRKSSIPKSFFTDKLNSFRLYCDWCCHHIEATEQLLGCVSHRRLCLARYPSADFFCWIDSDLVFSEQTLRMLEQALSIAQKKTPYFIITPEIVRTWDSTWDCLVNEHFSSEPFNYQQSNDPFADAKIYGTVSLEKVTGTSEGQPRFKFAGGWFTTISASLLRKVGIPESFGHYGLEDTFIMWCAEKMTQSGHYDVRQFKLKNVVVCENYRYRDETHYTRHLSLRNRKEEFLQIATNNFRKELDLFTSNLP